jgi:putative membrane protein insertion efficiency factor
MKKIILKAIKLYQRTVSPDHGWGRIFLRHAGCRFYPSCSAYATDAIMKYGIIKGSILGLWRILRCNPWSRGGHDPVR